ncbi:MAG: NUDIX domain-containing protein [Lachnospiraceae bacterium]|nr:NUDIX domain-containing protein [Lachnospiraceae bacterium]
MKYCVECGNKLILRKLDGEGMIPFCTACAQYRFPIFNTACSMVVLNPDKDKILLIQQYGREFYILVAGYVNKGECAEETVCREVKEEMGLHVMECGFNKSKYYAKSNTLMLNFYCVVDSEDLSGMTNEVDRADWFCFEEAKEQIRDGSLAEEFLLEFLNKYHKDI